MATLIGKRWAYLAISAAQNKGVNNELDEKTISKSNHVSKNIEPLLTTTVKSLFWAINLILIF